MKKQLLVLLLFGAFLGSPILAQNTCHDEVEYSEDSPTITVTVCGRKTSWEGAILGKLCNATATSSCTFTN
jgi:hypothetical protein